MKAHSRWLMVLVGSLVLLAGLETASASAAQPGLDPTYGQGGVAMLTLPQPWSPSPNQTISQFAPAVDGATYALATQQTCGYDTCQQSGTLYRVNPNGSFDAGFGGTGAVVLGSSEFGFKLAADSQGRALVGAIGPSSFVVRRFAADGRPDVGFGVGGAANLPCECEDAAIELMPAPREKIVAVVQHPTYTRRVGGNPPASFFRLLPDGSMDPSFGGDGQVGVGMKTRRAATAIAITPRGGILLGAIGCCVGARDYVLRVSAAGKFDSRFNATAGRSLRRLSRLGELSELNALVPRPNGTIDLLGSAPHVRGFDLRLRGNGRLARFGRRGLVSLPFTVASAAAGGGAVFAVGRLKNHCRCAFRILGNGRLDPRFGGNAGIEAPLPGQGITAASLGNGLAVVTDIGYSECRGGCHFTPGIARFVERASGP